MIKKINFDNIKITNRAVVSSSRRIDTFILYNELDLLELRLNILDPVMDKFVIVESTVEFSGKPKPLYFGDNQERFAPWKDKIKHVVVADTPDSGTNRWPREFFQRNAIMRGINNCRSDDLVFMSDVDEIPDPNTVQQNKQGGYKQIFSMYYLNTITHNNSTWIGTTAMYYSFFKKSNMQNIRNNRFKLKIVDPGGWHFTYLMTTEQIHNKLRAFSHSELDTTIVHKALDQRVKAGNDPFGRGPSYTKKVSLQDGYLPKYIKDNWQKYIKLIKY